jgi:hypothetical protein
MRSGTGSPEGVVTGVVCDQWHRTNTPFHIYVKTSGTGNTGWVVTTLASTNLTDTANIAYLNAATNAFTGNMTIGGTLGVGVAGTGTGTINLDGTASSSPLIVFKQNGTERVRLNYDHASGQLFIGAGALPSSSLSFSPSTGSFAVSGTGNVTFGGAPAFQVNMTTNAALFSGAVRINDTTDSTSVGTGSMFTAGGIGIAKALWVGGLANLNGGIAVDTSNFTVSGTTGAVTTASTLTVNGFGTHAFSAGGTGKNAIGLRNSTAGAGNYAEIAVGNDASAVRSYWEMFSTTYTPSGPALADGMLLENDGAGGVSLVAGHASGSVRLYSGSAISATPRLTVTSAGYVGIGTTGPLARLVVSDSGAAAIHFEPASGSIYAYNPATALYTPLSLTGSTFGFSISGATPTMSIDASSNVNLYKAIYVNTSGAVVSGFGNGVNIESWDAIGYASGGSVLALGGYRASQWVGVDFYTSGTRKAVVTSAGDVGILTQGNGLILKATDGANCFRVTVNNAGVLATASVTCP